MGDIFIHYLNLPFTVEGFSRKNHDDSYSVFLNARCSGEQQRIALEHEIKHIKENDLDSELDAIDIEKNMSRT